MKSTEPHSDVYFTFDIEVRFVQESILVCGVWQRCNGCFATCPHTEMLRDNDLHAGLHGRCRLQLRDDAADRPTDIVQSLQCGRDAVDVLYACIGQLVFHSFAS